MAIRMKCPDCGNPFVLSDSLKGQTISCDRCSAVLVVRGRAGSGPEGGEGYRFRQAAGPQPYLAGGVGNPSQDRDGEGAGWACGRRGEEPDEEDALPTLRRSQPTFSAAWILAVSVAAGSLVLLALLLVGVVVWQAPAYLGIAPPMPPPNPGGQPPPGNALPPPANLRPSASYFVADSSCLSLSADGTRLAIGSYDKTVRVFDVPARKEIAVLAGHDESVCSVALAPDGKTLASAGKDRVVHLWDVARKDRLHTLQAKYEPILVQFLPDGKALAVAGWGDGVRVLDVATKKVIATAKYERQINDFCITPDGRFLAMASADVRVWDLSAGQERVRLKNVSKGTLEAVAMTADGTRIASGSADGTILIWDVPSGELRRTIRPGNCIIRMVMTRDGRRLASGGQTEGTVRLWDAGNGQEIAVLPMFGPLLMAPDGATLVAGEDRRWVRAWDLSQLPGW